MIFADFARLYFSSLKMLLRKASAFSVKEAKSDSFTMIAVIMKCVDTDGLFSSHPNAPYSSVKAYTRSMRLNSRFFY